jgi:hypothetical protein
MKLLKSLTAKMSRTVVRIFSDNSGSLSFSLEEAPGEYLDGNKLHALDIASSDKLFDQFENGPTDPDVVEKAGKAIYDQLSAHGAVRQAIDAALSARVNQLAPIYVHLVGEAESVPWEALFANGRFLALDERWPIGRIAGTTAAVSPHLLSGVFEEPMRITAVLAAVGISAESEWQSLYDATRKSSPRVQLDVHVCEAGLFDQISELQGRDKSIAVHWITEDFNLADAFSNNDRLPHILHFFCHGASSLEGPHLEVATRLAFQDHSEPPVRIEASELVKANQEGDIWLVTLNCCKGAAGTRDSASFARQLMTTGYFPAVLGMREFVEAVDANIISRWLYPSVLNALSKSARAVGPQELDWASVLSAARERLCRKYMAAGQALGAAAACAKQWTVPVLYVRSQPFQIVTQEARPGLRLRGPSLDPMVRDELAAKLEQLRRIRADLPPGTPAAALSEIDVQVASLQEQLYPATVSAALRDAGRLISNFKVWGR